MALKAVKISSEALKQLEQLTSLDEETTKKDITEAINKAISNLYQKRFNEEVKLILTDNTEFQVKTKPEFTEEANKLLNHKGPYTVVKTCKSWVGISDGLYRLKEVDYLVPAAWFETTTPRNAKCPNRTLTAILALSSILQSGAILALFLL